MYFPNSSLNTARSQDLSGDQPANNRSDQELSPAQQLLHDLTAINFQIDRLHFAKEEPAQEPDDLPSVTPPPDSTITDNVGANNDSEDPFQFLDEMPKSPRNDPPKPSWSKRIGVALLGAAAFFGVYKYSTADGAGEDPARPAVSRGLDTNPLINEGPETRTRTASPRPLDGATTDTPPVAGQPIGDGNIYGTDYSRPLMMGLGVAIVGGIAYISYRSIQDKRRIQKELENDGPPSPGEPPQPPPQNQRRERGGDPNSMGGLTSLGQHAGSFVYERPKTRFTDIGGCDEIIEEFVEMKNDMKQVMRGNVKVHLPRGAVLSGPPGVGKTLFGRALAGETGLPFLQIDSSQSSTTILVGTGQMKIKGAFQEARKARDMMTKHLRGLPGATGKEEGICIMFFDEFDSIGSKRQSLDAGLGGADQERKNVVNALLNELDGLDSAKNKNILVFAATNFVEDLDPALLRPGRFTKKIAIPLPRSAEQRLDILQKLSKHVVDKAGYKIETPSSLEYIAKITPRKSGDDLRAILEEGVAIARRAERSSVSDDDLFEAYQRQSFGREKKNFLRPAKHELVINHELGHALCAISCGINIFLLSAEPRGDSGGRVVIDPEGIPEMLATKKDMLSTILLIAGGRAAEIEAYGDLGITSGADMDLEQLRGMVATMISSALFPGMYAQRIDRIPQHRWDKEHLAMVDKIANNAIDTARKVLQVIGPEKMKQLVEDTRTSKSRLVGDKAQAFFNERLSADEIAKMQAVADTFYRNPTGEVQ